MTAIETFLKNNAIDLGDGEYAVTPSMAATIAARFELPELRPGEYCVLETVSGDELCVELGTVH